MDLELKSPGELNHPELQVPGALPDLPQLVPEAPPQIREIRGISAGLEIGKGPGEKAPFPLLKMHGDLSEDPVRQIDAVIKLPFSF